VGTHAQAGRAPAGIPLPPPLLRAHPHTLRPSAARARMRSAISRATAALAARALPYTSARRRSRRRGSSPKSGPAGGAPRGGVAARRGAGGAAPAAPAAGGAIAGAGGPAAGARGRAAAAASASARGEAGAPPPQRVAGAGASESAACVHKYVSRVAEAALAVRQRVSAAAQIAGGFRGGGAEVQWLSEAASNVILSPPPGSAPVKRAPG
jgi:hypothetical protein